MWSINGSDAKRKNQKSLGLTWQIRQIRQFCGVCIKRNVQRTVHRRQSVIHVRLYGLYII